ncbi:MAG: P-II family nitrogen regulator [Gammaproteobacteria bacterium]
MKKIEAFVKAHRRDEVVRALHHVQDVTGITVTDARGFGRGRGGDEGRPSPGMIGDFIPNIRIEVFCRDELAERVVGAIEKAAHTGLRGDGKIYVIPVEQAVRISTGERGEAAV